MDLKFSKATDAEHEIELTPELISASWSAGAARAGGQATFEVRTLFVGNGAKIKVTAKTSDGKKLGKVSSVIKNNVFVGQIDIPEDIEKDDISFEVEFPGNGISGKSDFIPALPMIFVSNMKWSEMEAHRGDILTLSADVQGCENGTEAKVTIYEYDEDGVHDRIVELPAEVKDNKIEVLWEYEYHEDVDEIPTDEELEKYGKSYNPPEYFFVIEIDGQKFGREQESGLLTFKDFFELLVLDRDEMPMAEKEYVVTLPDGTEKKGKTDDKGFIRIEDIPPGNCEVDFPLPEEAESD